MLGSLDSKCLFREVNQSILGLISETTIWLSSKITDAIEEHGQPDITRPWFNDLFGLLRALAAMCAVIALLVSVLFAALSRDGGEIGRTLVRVLSAGVSTGLIIAIVTLAYQLIDEFCAMILGEGGWESITQALLTPAGYLWQIANMGSPSDPFVLMILISVAMLFALAVIWVEMIIRRMLIDMCVMMWPLAASGSVWSGARIWTRRLTDTIISLLVVKLIIVVLLKMSHDLLINANSADDLMIAAGLYWLGAFSPFMVTKIIGLVHGAINPGHTGEGMRQLATATTVAAATKALGVGSRLAAGAAGGPGAMLGGGRTPMPALTGPPTATDSSSTPADSAGSGTTPTQRDYSKVKPISDQALRAAGYEPYQGKSSTGNGGDGNSGNGRTGNGGGNEASETSSAAGARPSQLPAGPRDPHPAPKDSSGPSPAPSNPATSGAGRAGTPHPGGGPGGQRPAPPSSAPLMAEHLAEQQRARNYTPIPPALLPALGETPDAPAQRANAASPMTPAPLAGLRSYDDTQPIPDPAPPPAAPPPPPPGEQP
ncbi:hypothetical protein ACFV1N_20635 [Streptosporangium canum]|uniref:hypothetical protein n=1 Tax=Streptosporangium canum TaxID=324952 RepID=UPI0036B435D3